MFIVEYASHLWHAEGHYRDIRYAHMIADWMAGIGQRVRVREVNRVGKTLNVRLY